MRSRKWKLSEESDAEKPMIIRLDQPEELDISTGISQNCQVMPVCVGELGGARNLACTVRVKNSLWLRYSP